MPRKHTPGHVGYWDNARINLLGAFIRRGKSEDEIAQLLDTTPEDVINEAENQGFIKSSKDKKKKPLRDRQPNVMSQKEAEKMFPTIEWDKKKPKKTVAWTDDRNEKLMDMWRRGESPGKIALELGSTIDAITSQVGRLQRAGKFKMPSIVPLPKRSLVQDAKAAYKKHIRSSLEKDFGLLGKIIVRRWMPQEETGRGFSSTSKGSEVAITNVSRAIERGSGQAVVAIRQMGQRIDAVLGAQRAREAIKAAQVTDAARPNPGGVLGGVFGRGRFGRFGRAAGMIGVGAGAAALGYGASSLFASERSPYDVQPDENRSNELKSEMLDIKAREIQMTAEEIRFESPGGRAAKVEGLITPVVIVAGTKKATGQTGTVTESGGTDAVGETEASPSESPGGPSVPTAPSESGGGVPGGPSDTPSVPPVDQGGPHDPSMAQPHTQGRHGGPDRNDEHDGPVRPRGARPLAPTVPPQMPWGAPKGLGAFPEGMPQFPQAPYWSQAAPSDSGGGVPGGPTDGPPEIPRTPSDVTYGPSHDRSDVWSYERTGQGLEGWQRLAYENENLRRARPIPDDFNRSLTSGRYVPKYADDDGDTPTFRQNTPANVGVASGRQPRMPSEDTDAAIQRAARFAGVDVNDMRSMASVESDMKPSSNSNRRTQYKGLFQMGIRGQGSEWERYGRGGDPYDPNDNAMAAARSVKSNKEWFKARYGRDPNFNEIYMMHQQGRGFFSRGAMTNIAGNRYPGMNGPQSQESFMAGWGRELSRRSAHFANQFGSGNDDVKKVQTSRVPIDSMPQNQLPTATRPMNIGTASNVARMRQLPTTHEGETSMMSTNPSSARNFTDLMRADTVDHLDWSPSRNSQGAMGDRLGAATSEAAKGAASTESAPASDPPSTGGATKQSNDDHVPPTSWKDHFDSGVPGLNKEVQDSDIGIGP